MSTTEQGGLEHLNLPDARHSRLPRHGAGGAPVGALVSVVGGGVLLLLVAAYALVAAIAPGPAPRIAYADATTVQFVADPSLVEPVVADQLEPTAAGWLGTGDIVSNSEEAVPMASIVKLVTALVCLENRPIEAGSEGETVTWGEADAARAGEIAAAQGVTSGLDVGAQVSEKDLLALMLLPSASDAAYAYATSVFGSVDAFGEAANQWADAQGLDSVDVAGPDGLNPASIAAPADVVRLAKLALANPVIAELVALQTYDIPGLAEPVRNTNPLLGDVDGVVGVKTGTLLEYGSHLASAQTFEVDGRELTSVVAVMSRDAEARAADSRAVLEQLTTLPFAVEIVPPSTVLATATTAEGKSIELISSDEVTQVLVPGETAERTVTARTLQAGPIEADETVGTVTVSSPAGKADVQLVASQTLPAPGYWWKFTHPFQLFS